MASMPSMPNKGGRSSASKIKRSDAGGAGLLTLVLVTVSLIVFTLSVRENGKGFFTGTRNVVQTIVYPLRLAGAGVVAPFSGMSNIMRNLTADEKTLSELQAENERLAARNVELEEAEVTVQQLRDLLDLKNTYNLQSTAASVIAGSTDSWTSSVTIDKGSLAGLSVGMPVVDGKGAVGQLIECSPTTSTVRLLIDEGSSVSAMIQTSRAQGMLEGSPDGTLRLMFVRTDQTVDVGDVVVTGGLGGVYPKGLPLGKIVTVQSSPGSTYYDIVVEPFAHMGSLEQVQVITSLTKEQEASSEDIESADSADLEAASGRLVDAKDSEKSKDKSGSDDDEDAEGEQKGNTEDEDEEEADDRYAQFDKRTTSKDDNTTEDDVGEV